MKSIQPPVRPPAGVQRRFYWFYWFYRTCYSQTLVHLYLPLHWHRVLSLSEFLSKKAETHKPRPRTKPTNTIGLIKLIGCVCRAWRAACQSNAGNSLSSPLEATGRINLTAKRVIGQSCTACICQVRDWRLEYFWPTGPSEPSEPSGPSGPSGRENNRYLR